MLSYSIVKLDPQCLVKKRRGNEYLALTISAILAFIGENGLNDHRNFVFSYLS